MFALKICFPDVFFLNTDMYVTGRDLHFNVSVQDAKIPFSYGINVI